LVSPQEWIKHDCFNETPLQLYKFRTKTSRLRLGQALSDVGVGRKAGAVAL
jgi:hypothetical protein